MLHINDLDPEVLYRILCLASGEPAKDIDKWKHKLTLLQVCAKWYDLLKGYVFAQGFVGVYPLNGFDDSGRKVINSCIYFADNDIVCKSNLGIITGRDKYNCDCVSKLSIYFSGDLYISQHGHVLKNISALGVGYWLNLSSIEFVYFFGGKGSSQFEVANLDKLSMDVSEYIHDFQNRAPNITCLDLSAYDKFASSAIPILIDHYAPQLQRLRIFHPIILPLPQFSTKLTHLLLNLTKYKHQRSSFHAKSLQSLRFSGISSSNFSWWMFHNFITPGRIEFTNLKSLKLSYKDQTEQEQSLSENYSKQARPYGSHMLQFPKLESLTLCNPPVDCDVFYTDTIPKHLDSLDIEGACNSVVAASRLWFTSVNKMTIAVFNKEEKLSDAFYIAADLYFGYTKIGSSCTVRIDPLIDIKRTVSWVNVTDLTLRIIGFDELLKHIPNFYNLRKLNVNNVSLSDESLSIIRTGLEEEEQGKFEYLDTRLEYISINGTEPEDPYNLLAILNHILIRAATLRSINIGKGKGGIVEKSFLPEKFPHIDVSYEFFSVLEYYHPNGIGLNEHGVVGYI